LYDFSDRRNTVRRLLKLVRKWIVGLMLLVPAACASQVVESPVTIRVNSSLVLVDVITQDTKTALPLQGGKKEDFRVFDNDAEMQVESFDVGARYSTRPITLWFAVICNEVNWDVNGSGFMRGKTKLLRPALDHLDKNDTVGVEHWCDDQKHSIDISPSQDLDGALAVLEKQSHGWAKAVGTRKGEIALQEMLEAILESTHQAKAEALPVIVFLYGDHSGMEREELDRILADLLQTSCIVFGINVGGVPLWKDFTDNPHSQPNVAHFLSFRTGGQYFSVDPKLFATALDDILVQVHFRYVLGFRPPAFDAKTHTLRVEFTEAAKTRFPTARLTYRPAYIPTAQK